MGYHHSMKERYFTVIETEYYLGKARKILSEQQRDEVVTIVAQKPESGEMMQGTGGVYKFRYASQEGKGKSGGARIIHLPLVSRGKVYLLDMFEKNDKVNVTKAERNEMAQIVRVMKGRGT